MSATVDAARTEAAHESRNERAKRRLRLAGDVSKLSYEGLTVEVMAARLGVSERVIVWWRRALGWQRLRGQAGRGLLHEPAQYPEVE